MLKVPAVALSRPRRALFLSFMTLSSLRTLSKHRAIVFEISNRARQDDLTALFVLAAVNRTFNIRDRLDLSAESAKESANRRRD
jgi:hypothetical protein